MRSGSSSPASIQDTSHYTEEIHRTPSRKGFESDNSISCTGIAKNSKQSIDLIPTGVAVKTADMWPRKRAQSAKTILVPG